MFTRRVMTSILLSFAFLTGATATRAQDKFPSRTIRIIVPFAPGGGVDTLARLLAERMQAKMSVNVIVRTARAPTVQSAARMLCNRNLMVIRCCSPRIHTRCRSW